MKEAWNLGFYRSLSFLPWQRRAPAPVGTGAGRLKEATRTVVGPLRASSPRPLATPLR